MESSGVTGMAAVVCGMVKPDGLGVIRPCIRSAGHPWLHRDEYGQTWSAGEGGPRAGDLGDLAGLLAEERRAHQETRDHRNRALKVAQDYRVQAGQLQTQLDAMAEPEPEPCSRGAAADGGDGGGAAGGGAAAGGEDTRTHATELALATVGALGRACELLALDPQHTSMGTLGHILALAHRRLHTLERVLGVRATPPPGAPGA